MVFVKSTDRTNLNRIWRDMCDRIGELDSDEAPGTGSNKPDLGTTIPRSGDLGPGDVAQASNSENDAEDGNRSDMRIRYCELRELLGTISSNGKPKASRTVSPAVVLEAP